jgi:hypothetical protein
MSNKQKNSFNFGSNQKSSKQNKTSSPHKEKSNDISSLKNQAKRNTGRAETKNKPLTIGSTQKNTTVLASSTTNLIKSGSITVEVLAFIPKRLGSPIWEIINAKEARDQAGLSAKLKAITNTYAKEPFSTGGSSIYRGISLDQIETETPWYFATDDRDFGGGSYRLGLKTAVPIQVASIGNLFSRVPSLKNKLFQVSCCESKRVRAVFTGAVKSEKGMKWDRWKVIEEKKRATASEEQGLKEETGDSFTYSIAAHAIYPFASETFAPDIEIRIELKVRRNSSNGKVYIDISGQHNHFPFYEILVNSRSVYTYASENSGPGFWNLSLLHDFNKVVVMG